MCLYGNYGCDKREYEEQCVMSIWDTEGGPTSARFLLVDEDELNVNFTANITEKVTEPVFFSRQTVELQLSAESSR